MYPPSIIQPSSIHPSIYLCIHHLSNHHSSIYLSIHASIYPCIHHLSSNHHPSIFIHVFTIYHPTIIHLSIHPSIHLLGLQIISAHILLFWPLGFLPKTEGHCLRAGCGQAVTKLSKQWDIFPVRGYLCYVHIIKQKETSKTLKAVHFIESSESQW